MKLLELSGANSGNAEARHLGTLAAADASKILMVALAGRFGAVSQVAEMNAFI